MGMYDEIIVPKSYLKGLAPDKELERCLFPYHTFQTKELECMMGTYKLHRRVLYHQECFTNQWERHNVTTSFVFYDVIVTDDGATLMVEYKASIKKGRLSWIKHRKTELLSTKEEREEEEKRCEQMMARMQRHRMKPMIKLLNWASDKFLHTSNWLRRKATLKDED